MSEHLKVVKNIPGKGNSKGKGPELKPAGVFEQQQEVRVAGYSN